MKIIQCVNSYLTIRQYFTVRDYFHIYYLVQSSKLPRVTVGLFFILHKEMEYRVGI